MLIERDETCIRTLNSNRRLLGLETDARAVDAFAADIAAFRGDVDLLAAGVPCQPFSFGGKSDGHIDRRNAFPALVRGISELRPRAVLVENVKGFASETFLDYFEYVTRQMEMPELALRPGETWRSHRLRMNSNRATYARSGALRYRVHAEILQAADYGTPQLRERLFIVAFRSDLDRTWTRPPASHSRLRLLHDMFVSESYWRSHMLRAHRCPAQHQAALEKVAKRPREEPWRSVRDTIAEMPQPSTVDDMMSRHVVHPGATSYEGHRGSRWDWPAKTIKAGVHGVPGGENMIRLANGRSRYFTLREAARLQDFPDNYKFAGTWTDAYRQLGNAVPVRLGSVVGKSIASVLEATEAPPAGALVTALRRIAN